MAFTSLEKGILRKNKQLKLSDMDLENLSKQGEYSSIDNMRRAIKDIDDTFGPGYAKEHPELVGKIVMASAIDYCGTVLHIDLKELTEVISNLKTD